jgi:hypothetical protein
MHENSLQIMEAFRGKYLADMRGCTVLDVGSQCIRRQPTYRPLFVDYCYVGMDVVAGPNVDIVGYDTLSLYDVVISGQVMEHVARPWEWLPSLTRYFRKFICIVVPNTHQEHRYPIDCYRYFPDGMRALFEFAKIKELEIRQVGLDTVGIGCHA